jgi:hypothetical protein
MLQPCVASSSGSMCVSVKKTKSNEPGGWLEAGSVAPQTAALIPESAAVAPVARMALRNSRRSRASVDSW